MSSREPLTGRHIPYVLAAAIVLTAALVTALDLISRAVLR